MSAQQQCAWMIYKPCHVSHKCLTSERPCRAAYGEAQLSDHTGRVYELQQYALLGENIPKPEDRPHS